jgi:hypothetical protein
MRYAWGALMINQFQDVKPPPASDPAAALAAALQPGSDPLKYFQLPSGPAAGWAYFGYLAAALPVLLVANILAGRLLIHNSKK